MAEYCQLPFKIRFILVFGTLFSWALASQTKRKIATFEGLIYISIDLSTFIFSLIMNIIFDFLENIHFDIVIAKYLVILK